jgi:hypothetical protein
MTPETLERLGFRHSVWNGQDCYVHQSELTPYLKNTTCTYRLVLCDNQKVVVSVGDNEVGILLTVFDDVSDLKLFWYLTHKEELIEV